MSKSWAASQNLPVSKENPADKSQMIYFVAALHQLHCLVCYCRLLFENDNNAYATHLDRRSGLAPSPKGG